MAEGKSKTLASKHLDRLAADIVLYRNNVPDFTPLAYKPYGEYWEQLGGTWGGRFKPLDKEGIGWDPVHFEWK